ncbi:MAG: peptide deformylase [bacterium]|nr:peptide deformylase [bacterium]
MNKPLVIQVLHLGHSNLRKIAEQVKDIHAPEVQSVIDNLLATCAEGGGVGIAAPQIDEGIRVIVVASNPNPRYPLAPKMAPTPMINPQIVTKSKSMKKDWEGCLSVPGIRAQVPRHTWITIVYTDRKGKIKNARYTDFLARIFQHELDHLNGVIFLDHAVGREMMAEKEYLKMMNAQMKLHRAQNKKRK